MKTVLHTVLAAAVLAAGTASALADADEAAVTRRTELRADKLPQAAVVRDLDAGTPLKVMSLEGGWAWVEDRGTRGWVRAGALKFSPAGTVASLPASARETAGAGVLTLGVRALPPRTGRHALIITVGRYADGNVPPLPGTAIDRESATQIAQAMQIPRENIRYLRDSEATGDAIRNALRELEQKVVEGDRVYVHFSGHGTRYLDAKSGGCVEALLAHDGGWPGTITNREMAELLAPLGRKTDKMFVMYDACHSGGVLTSEPGMRARGISLPTDEGELRPRFTQTNEDCGRPVNVKTRNLMVEAVETGTLPQDIVHLSSSRDNEISFDDEQKGGLATQFMRDCMLRDAVDLDGSGAISIDEVRACAQQKMNKRLENDARFKPSTLVLSGNTGFVPAWFGSSQLAQAANATRPPAAVPAVQTPATPVPVPTPAVQTGTGSQKPPAATTTVAVQPPATPPASTLKPPAQTVAVQPPRPPAQAVPPAVVVPVAPTPVAQIPEPPPLTGRQALQQLYEQRDAKRQIRVTARAEKLQIRKDALEFTVQSDRPGYVYVAMAGSDNQALHILFPNDLDKNNAIEAGKPLALPRANWRVRAGGPVGTNNLLVIVSDARRDVEALSSAKDGPFLKSLNNAQGRADLGALMTRARNDPAVDCSMLGRLKNPAACSDAFGAAMFKVEEVQ